MKSSWAKPSLSRDFTILAGVILCVLVVLSIWVLWSIYMQQSARILDELQKEATRIDRTLEREISHTGYLLRALGQQISRLPPGDKRSIAQLLTTYHAHSKVYAIWSWTDPTQHVVVSSNRGILDEPVNVSDRDYIQKGQVDPWQLQIGNPIQGRVSERWVIPIGLGVSDDTGKFLGTLAASVDIGAISEEISGFIKREGISFAIVSKTKVKLTEVSDTSGFIDTYFPPQRLEHIDMSQETSGIVSQAKIFPFFHGIYAYYQMSQHYPYILLIGFDPQHSQEALERQMLPRLLQIGTLACFLLLFLWIVRVRIIKPVVELTEIVGNLTRGEPYAHLKQIGPVEIDQLAAQIAKVSDFVEERGRLEEELREKLDQLLQKEQNGKPGRRTFVTE